MPFKLSKSPLYKRTKNIIKMISSHFTFFCFFQRKSTQKLKIYLSQQFYGYINACKLKSQYGGESILKITVMLMYKKFNFSQFSILLHLIIYEFLYISIYIKSRSNRQLFSFFATLLPLFHFFFNLLHSLRDN